MVGVTDDDLAGRDRRWLLIVARVPPEPARHRMAVWRRLRRSGAIALGQALWAVPDLPASEPLLVDLTELVAAADGSLLVMVARGRGDGDQRAIADAYARERTDEWAEFLDDCAKYEAELVKEHRQGKYTLAELEEEEQSLDRLRRWYRDLRSRDVLGLSAVTTAADTLKACESSFDRYAERVYAAVREPLV